MSSKLAVVALVLLFGYMLAGVDADPIAKQDTQSNWLSVPHEYLRNAYSEVEKAAAEFSQTPFFTEARNHWSTALDKLNALFYQPPAK